MPNWPFFGENFENWYPAFPLKPAFLGFFLSEKVFFKAPNTFNHVLRSPKRQMTMSSFLHSRGPELLADSSTDLPTSARAEVERLSEANTRADWREEN